MMTLDTHIVLIGMPGSGKSTLAPLLAEQLGRACYDSDDVITSTCGVTPKTFIQTQGEEAFRDQEYQTLVSLFKKPLAVISTGGGCVTHAPIRSLLKNHHVIYLTAHPETLFHRLLNSHDRAFFDKANLEAMPAFLSNTLQARAAYYEAIAHETWCVDTLTPQQLCAQWEGSHVAE